MKKLQLSLLILFCFISYFSSAQSTSTIKSNFNGTSIAGGNYIWFHAHLKFSKRPTTDFTLYVDADTITWKQSGTPVTLLAPSSVITFTSAASTTSYTFSGNQWHITVPLSSAGNDEIFTGGITYPVPAGGMPGGINPVVWKQHYSTDATSKVALTWQWSAAVYTNFTTIYDSLGVVLLHNAAPHAGTPNSYKNYVVGGARGGGGANYTGSWSGTGSAIADTVVNNIVNYILVSPIVILQGASNGATTGANMSTNLNLLNVIPLSQPYNVSPFNYDGSETVPAIPNANVVDWVLVDIRKVDSPSVIIETRAAFLLNNDTVVDLDGMSPVSFVNVPAGTYFVSVRHRNHLAVRSSVPITFPGGMPQYYDFTTAQTQAYQNAALLSFNNAMVQIAGNGKYALWGGNANNDGAGAAQVNYQGFANDRVTVLADQGGTQGAFLAPIYSRSDVNMNGQLNYQGFQNDRIAILGFIGGNQATIILQHL